jgi:hypothetical protein
LEAADRIYETGARYLLTLRSCQVSPPSRSTIRRRYISPKPNENSSRQLPELPYDRCVFTNVDDRCGVHKPYGNMTLLIGIVFHGAVAARENFNNSVKAYRPLLCAPTLAFPLPWQSTSYLSKVHDTLPPYCNHTYRLCSLSMHYR